MSWLIKSVRNIGIALSGWVFFTSLSYAEPNDMRSEQPDSEWWQSTHETMSTKVGEWSNGLDAFFSGRRHEEASTSFVSMRFGSIIEKKEGVSGFFNLDAKLDLPYTEDRFDLIIESDADELTQDNRLVDNQPGQNILQSATSTRFATMLRYFKEEWNANIDMGLILKMPVDPFVRITFEQNYGLGKWSLKQSESLFEYYSLGYGGRYSVGTRRPIGQHLEFGADLGVTYLEVDSETYWRQNIFLNQDISDKSKLRYQLSYLQEGSTPHAESFLYFVEYQRVLHNNWLIGQLKPQMTHERDNAYKPEFSLSASLEILLGPRFL